MTGGEEEVLVVPTRLVIPASRGWRGVRRVPLDRLLRVVERDGYFRPRRQMETDPAWKQIIPYLVLRDQGRYFLMRRTRAGADARLHDRFSIGIGGHLNPGDATVQGGLAREWAEEIAADFEPDFRFIGLLNDDETEVGRVHLGVVFEAEADGRQAVIREADKLVGRFVEPTEVAAVSARLETWSQLVFEHLESRPG